MKKRWYRHISPIRSIRFSSELSAGRQYFAAMHILNTHNAKSYGEVVLERKKDGKGRYEVLKPRIFLQVAVHILQRAGHQRMSEGCSLVLALEEQCVDGNVLKILKSASRKWFAFSRKQTDFTSIPRTKTILSFFQRVLQELAPSKTHAVEATGLGFTFRMKPGVIRVIAIRFCYLESDEKHPPGSMDFDRRRVIYDGSILSR